MALAAAPVGSTADEPVYVHDGPPGREAWLVRVHSRDFGTRQILVTRGGAYERRPTASQDAE